MGIESLTDKELVLMAKEKSSFGKAYTTLFNRYRILLINYLERQFQNLNSKEYEDLVQDTMAKVHNNLKKYDPKRGQFSTWIYKVAKNTTIDHLRREKRKRGPVINFEDLKVKENEKRRGNISKEGLFEQNTYMSPDEMIDREKIYETLYSAIKKLSKNHREPLKLRLKEYPYQEISEILNKPLGTIKGYLFHAKKDLKKILDEDFFKDYLYD